MSYDLRIYPVQVMHFVKAGGRWEDAPPNALPADEVKRVEARLVLYGYSLVSEPAVGHRYEKDFAGQPVQVSVYDTEIAFSTPYWDGMQDALFDIRMDAIELADSPQLALYDPQTDEWFGDE